VEQSLTGCRVLVVDDNDDGRWLVGTILLCYGAVVDLASSVDEALGLYREASPDVVVSDIGMPELDGTDLIRALRTQDGETGRTIPAVAVSGYTSEEDRAEALAAGFDEFLARPFDPDHLVWTVARLIARKREAGN
jgi:CheY-like chemotaxis protein